jgi:putative membrane protein
MISYNPKDWFTFIFKIHKTETMQKLLPLLFGVGLYAGAWAYFENIYLAKNHIIDLFKNIGIIYSILGFTLSLFLVFRTNTAYDRWWEGRRLWGDLNNAIRNISIHLHSCLPIENDQRRHYYSALMHLFSIALKQHLQDKRLHGNHFEIFEDKNPIFEEKSEILKINNQPQFIAKLIFLALKADVRHGLFSIHDLELFRTELNKFMEVAGGCERIKNTPIPFTYSVFIIIKWRCFQRSLQPHDAIRYRTLCIRIYKGTYQGRAFNCECRWQPSVSYDHYRREKRLGVSQRS